ncbi:MAG: BrnT family toxin [Bryobacterales bacterium]|nr:BrnT family toxin [Bryobacterales bacterium]
MGGPHFGRRHRQCDTLRIYVVKYEWDERKNRQNQRKHDGVSFELASLVFEDGRCLIGPDRIDEATGEQRWHALGKVQLEPRATAVLFVVHVYREVLNGEEIIRIISARAAEKHEVRRYQEQAMD